MREYAIAFYQGSTIMVHESAWFSDTEPEPRRRRPRDRAGVTALLAAGADPFLDLSTCSDYLGVGRRTLERWIDLPPDEALPSYRLKGKIVIRRSEADAYMERHRSRGRPSLTRALRELGLVSDDA